MMSSPMTGPALSLFTGFEGETDLDPAARHEAILDTMRDQVVAWAAALRPLRAA